MSLHVTLSELRGERGWSDGAIRRLLVRPDRIVPNPYYRSSVVKLYDLERVRAVERSPWFAKRVPSARRRRAAAKGVQTRVDNLAKWARTVPITCRFPHPDELRGDSRHRVNYLRHGCSSYDDVLGRTRGEAGRNAAGAIIKNRVLAKIARQYPELEGEATRQLLDVGALAQRPKGCERDKQQNVITAFTS